MKHPNLLSVILELLSFVGEIVAIQAIWSANKNESTTERFQPVGDRYCCHRIRLEGTAQPVARPGTICDAGRYCSRRKSHTMTTGFESIRNLR